MFGFRFDGRRAKNVGPIQMMTGYLMPQRCDAQVWTPQEVDYDKVAAYIQQQRSLGHTISFMSIIVAAFIRVMAEYPMVNRFVMNKQIFARNEITSSFMVLKRHEGGEHPEASAAKVKFDPYDTIYDVAMRMEESIEQNRTPSAMGNATERLARGLLSLPLLPTLLIGGIRLLDRYGLLPKAIIDLSPFHTSVFITNMASLGIGYIYHHIYNFGTTSLFLSIGKISRKARVNANGQVVIKRVIPMGFVGDERIMDGFTYALVFRAWRSYIENPALLELPPTQVKIEAHGTLDWVKHPKTKSHIKPTAPRQQ